MTELEKTEVQKQPWGAPAALIVGFIAYVVSQLSVGLLVWPFVKDGTQASLDKIQVPWVSLVLTALSSAVMLGVVILFLRRKHFKVRDFGFFRPTLKSVLFAVGAYIGYFAVFLVSVTLITALVPSFNESEAQDVGFIGAQGWQLVLAFIGLVIIAPITEEIFFRGFLFRGLRRSWPLWLAFIGTSAAFALAHGQWNVGIDTFILSLFLILVYQKTGNLWLSIAMHATKNLIAFLFLFVFVS